MRGNRKQSAPYFAVLVSIRQCVAIRIVCPNARRNARGAAATSQAVGNRPITEAKIRRMGGWYSATRCPNSRARMWQERLGRLRWEVSVNYIGRRIWPPPDGDPPW